MMEDQTKEVAASIRHELGSLHDISLNRCIYRVPEHLRKVNEEAYRPLVVSIGPFYYQDISLQVMQKQKLRHLQKFLQRNNAQSLEDYVSYVKYWEKVAREYYDEEIRLPTNEFIKLLLLDTIFIIEFLVGLKLEGPFSNQKIEMMYQVSRDLLVEENQLPFFILEGLYEVAFGGTDFSTYPSFIDLISGFISFFCSAESDVETANASREKMKNASNIRHLVDLARICLLPSIEQLPKSNENGVNLDQFPKSASELSAAGVKFVARDHSNNKIRDIAFVKGVLKIPKFKVDDFTESIFRNIIVLEQCHYAFQSYVLDYMLFLDGLINTSEDVQILVESGIIETSIGNNEEVANLFNKMGKQTVSYSNIYARISAELNGYANIQCNKWMAILKRKYFNHPWSIISVIYAVVLFVLTILQTIAGFTSNN